MIRSTRDPGPSLLAAVVPVCVVILVVGLIAVNAAVNEQTRQTICADPDAPAAPRDCEETP